MSCHPHRAQSGPSRSAAFVAAYALLSIGVGACFIPVNTIEPASPRLIGQIYSPAGTPARGTRVALADSRGQCRRVTTRTRTDDRGTFQLDPTTIHRRWALIFPPFERFSNAYGLCVAADDSIYVMAYEGRISLGATAALERDSVRCIEWVWDQHMRVACTGPNQPHAMQTAGRWRTNGDSGTYRLIVIGSNMELGARAVFLQWVETTGDGPGRVRQTTELPVAAKLQGIDEATLRAELGKPARVVLRSHGRPAHLYSWGPARRCDVFELGAPGEIRALPCP